MRREQKIKAAEQRFEEHTAAGRAASSPAVTVTELNSRALFAEIARMAAITNGGRPALRLIRGELT